MRCQTFAEPCAMNSRTMRLPSFVWTISARTSCDLHSRYQNCLPSRENTTHVSNSSRRSLSFSSSFSSTFNCERYSHKTRWKIAWDTAPFSVLFNLRFSISTEVVHRKNNTHTRSRFSFTDARIRFLFSMSAVSNTPFNPFFNSSLSFLNHRGSSQRGGREVTARY